MDVVRSEKGAQIIEEMGYVPAFKSRAIALNFFGGDEMKNKEKIFEILIKMLTCFQCLF